MSRKANPGQKKTGRNVCLTEAKWEELKVIAHERGLSGGVSAILQEAVDEWLEKRCYVRAPAVVTYDDII